MDFTESTKAVYDRIQQLEPDHVSKIIGYLLLQDHGDRDMIRLAFCPDSVIHSLVQRAKSDLGLSLQKQVTGSPPDVLPLQFTPFNPCHARNLSVSDPAVMRSGLWDQHKVKSVEFVQNQMQLVNLDGQSQIDPVGSDYAGNYFHPEQAMAMRSSRRSPSLPEFPVKVCHYFNKGFCKHGNNCRYFHAHLVPEGESFFQMMFNLNSSEPAGNEDQLVSPGSLEKLQTEIIELLKARRGMPVSIASLPMLYYEKYGKTLQAEGYLTESQRHGKAGYSLTKLLARLKNTIRVIDRPHGQHAVILAEDVQRFLEYSGERNEYGGIVAGARQIYLTFPAESTFSEQDVSNYFSKFGPVQDVRIPCQHKRMFGFVTFVYVQTVRQILAKGNPHFVCGARVLVKPYKEKSRPERKYGDKVLYAMHCSPNFMDRDSELCSFAKVTEHESRHLSEFQFASRPLPPYLCFGYSMDDLKKLTNEVEIPSVERFNFLLDVLNTESSREDKVKHISTNYKDQDSSQSLNLPESPFSMAIGNGISTVM